MRWEEATFAVLDDLEQQAHGLGLMQRDAEVADLSQVEYSRVTLAMRVHASLGRVVRLRLHGGLVVRGRVARVGADWLLVSDDSSEWVVSSAGIVTAEGLAARADNEETWSVTDRLSLRSALRRLSGSGEGCTVHLRDAGTAQGRVGRVGADFFELHRHVGAEQTTQVVPLASAVAFQASPS